LDAEGAWQVIGPVPPDPTLDLGIDLGFTVLTFDAGGAIVLTNEEMVSFNQ
jgi:hypothetical protein